MMAWRAAGIALGLICGIAIAAGGLYLSPVVLWILAIVGAATTAAGYMAERRWIPWPKALIAVAALVCALPLGYFRTMDVIGPSKEGSLRQIIETMEPGVDLTVRGAISAEPELRGAGQLDVYIRVDEIRMGDQDTAPWTPVEEGQILVRAYSRASNARETHEHFNRLAAPAAYGWEVAVSGSYTPIDPPLNPGEFDYAYFLTQSGVDTRIRTHVNELEVLSEARGNPVVELALATKTSFLETFKDTVRAPASRLTSAATLGARRAVENIEFRGQDIATTLRHAGVGHVLAVSGLHVSVIAVMLFALFRMTGLKPKVFVPILIVFLILFALLTGARPSSVRAVIMNSVVLISLAYLRMDFRSATVIGLSLSSFFILTRNPTVLFAPSFLLSYGAVLSLIVIAPPLDRLLCRFRGFALLFAALWFALLLRLAGWHLEWLIQPTHLVAYLGFLWLLALLGARLNNRFPYMWTISLQRIPSLVRLFFAAQLAIQLGMMVPLSAWFFGLFPVAGVLVNLLAIPGVGVLVQLGMLTGLVGLIPVVGPWLSIPFGAATTLTGDFFIWVAYAGAYVFPFPATPMPTTFWMGAYYGTLIALLLLEGKRAWVFGLLYRVLPPGPPHPVKRRLALALPIVLMVLPVFDRTPDEPTLSEVRVLAEGRYPILLLSGRDSTTLINSGGSFAGGRLVFSSLRTVGATQVDTAILPSTDPRAGIGGIAELLEQMHVDTVLLGVLPEPGQSMPDAIGDDYLIRQAEQGQFWAENIEDGFEQLRERAAAHNTTLAELTEDALPAWSNGELALLPALEERPDRYVSSAITPILHARINGLDWIIVTDTTPDALFAAFENTTSSDVLVVPNLHSYYTYGRWLRTALIRVKPRLLIIGGGDRELIDPDDLDSWIPEFGDRVIIETGREGAVMARLLPNEVTEFSTHRGDTQLTLRPGETDTED